MFELVEKLMLQYAYDTGLSSNLKPRRYLWTDAFAVCNFLELWRRTSNNTYLNLALKLVDQVHYVLGRHRGDDNRRGWISGLSDEEGSKHPTIGGLRIGKPLPERGPDEPYDDELEWERDGQYYHYLTKWMHALNRVYRATGNLVYKVWAIELAKTAHRAFVYTASNGCKRMYWKMSIDLSRPLVKSMGLHDPLDGLITYIELAIDAPNNAQLSLQSEVKDMEEMCQGVDWTTNDPLGVGELLWCAHSLANFIAMSRLNKMDLLVEVLNSALVSLELSLSTGFLDLPASVRLAFRELGLSIGLKAIDKMSKLIEVCDVLKSNDDVYSAVKVLANYRWIASKIERYWLRLISMESESWIKHRDINMVMLATSLMPGEFLGAR